jgi:hypothetical protein
LRDSVTWRAMPERSKGRVQTKRDTLVVQVGGWAWGLQPHPVKRIVVQKPNNQPRISGTYGKRTKQRIRNKDIAMEKL